MNVRTNSVLLLAATLSTLTFSSLSAAPQTSSSFGYWASKISATSWDVMRETSQTQTISTGSTRASVLSLLGKPLQALAPDVYLYDNCRPDQSLVSDRDCNALIVRFAQDRVVDLRFVNDQAKAIIAANLLANRTDRDAPGSGPMISAGFAISNT